MRAPAPGLFPPVLVMDIRYIGLGMLRLLVHVEGGMFPSCFWAVFVNVVAVVMAMAVFMHRVRMPVRVHMDFGCDEPGPRTRMTPRLPVHHRNAISLGQVQGEEDGCGSDHDDCSCHSYPCVFPEHYDCNHCRCDCLEIKEQCCSSRRCRRKACQEQER